MKFSNLLLFGSALLTEVFAAPVEQNDYNDGEVDGIYYRDDYGKAIRLRKRDVDTANLLANAWYQTVTTTVDGKYGTYLEVVYTSTIRPASTFVVTKTYYSTSTLQNGAVTTVSSVAKSTTTQSAILATNPSEANAAATATSTEDSGAYETEDYNSTGSDLESSIPVSTTAEATTNYTPSTSSGSTLSTITSSPVSNSNVQKVTASVSYSFPSSSGSQGSLSYTPYYTETAGDGVCIVYYAEDDETESYDDDAPYTTLTLTSVVATVTLTQS